MNPAGSRLEIDVDELVVRGLPPSQARAVVAALEQRLNEIGAEWAGSGSTITARDEPFRRAPAVTPEAPTPAAVGEAAAAAIWGTIAGGDRR